MTYHVVLHPEAEKEYLSSYFWYEERSPGLGERFAKTIDATIQYIANYPLHYPEKKKSYREALTNTFPFLIIYKTYPEKKEIFVASIFHTKRKPKKKYR